MPADDEQSAMREALKKTAVTLKQSGIAFALGGGYASWARGGPEPEHDVDFLVPEADAERAAKALSEGGLRVEHPPEDWLFKVFDDRAMVDVIFRMNGVPVDAAVLERADEYEVLSVQMPVLGATDLMASKINALDEHYCDYSRLLPVALSLREQVDWNEVRAAVAGNDFGLAFLFLLERMEIIGTAEDPAPSG
jgi:hypothetical protein